MRICGQFSLLALPCFIPPDRPVVVHRTVRCAGLSSDGVHEVRPHLAFLRAPDRPVVLIVRDQPLMLDRPVVVRCLTVGPSDMCQPAGFDSCCLCALDRPVLVHRIIRCVLQGGCWLILRHFSSAFEQVLPRGFLQCVLGLVGCPCYATLHIVIREVFFGVVFLGDLFNTSRSLFRSS